MFDIDRNGIWICRCCCFCGEFLVFVRFIDRFCGEKREIKRTGNAAIGRWISMQTTLRDLWRSSMSGIVANQRDTWTKKKPNIGHFSRHLEMITTKNSHFSFELTEIDFVWSPASFQNEAPRDFISLNQWRLNEMSWRRTILMNESTVSKRNAPFNDGESNTFNSSRFISRFQLIGWFVQRWSGRPIRFEWIMNDAMVNSTTVTLSSFGRCCRPTPTLYESTTRTLNE